MPAHKRRLRFSPGVLEHARNVFLGANRNDETEIEGNEIVITDKVSRKSYNRRCSECKLPVSVRLIDGQVIAYEVPLSTHSSAAGEILSWGYRGEILGWSYREHIVPLVKLDVFTGPRSMLQPDISFLPRELIKVKLPAGQAANSGGDSYPTMVVEVGNFESLSSLHSLAPHYFSARTTIQIYLAIKIFPVRPDATRSLLALLYLRPNVVPILVKSFGTAPLHHTTITYLQNVGVQSNVITGVGFGAPPCNRPEIPDYQIAIPPARIFDAIPVPPEMANDFMLDLWKLQRAIMPFDVIPLL